MSLFRRMIMMAAAAVEYITAWRHGDPWRHGEAW